MSSKPLFTLEIPHSSGGTVTCTSPSAKVYLLTFTSPPDNRLLTSFCQTILLALDILEFSYPHGVVVTTSGIQKFYSNGLELEHASSTPGFFPNTLFALFKRLLLYPMPTIALVNGHAFAGGFMLSMYHDYRIFNPSRGYLCLNELDLGVPLKPAMSSIFRQKLSPAVYQPMVLEAKRFGAAEALECRIVDVLGGINELLKFVEEKKLMEKAKTGVYAILKAEMYRETLGYLEEYDKEEQRSKAYLEKDDNRKEEGEKRIAEWAATVSKAKL